MPNTCGQHVDVRRKPHGKSRAQLSTDQVSSRHRAIYHSVQARFSPDLSDTFHSTSPHRNSLFNLCLNTFFTQFPQPLLLQQRS